MLWYEKVFNSFEKSLMAMTTLLPYSETDIKSRPYKEYYALANRAYEINEQRKNSKR